METRNYKQTGIRLPEELITGLKRKAKSKGMSFNAYVESVLEEDIKAEIPYIDPDEEIDSDILALSGILKMPSRMEIEVDPRLKTILTQ